MPKTIIKTVYTFRELLDLNKEGTVARKAVERARTWLQEAATDFGWYSDVLDLWKQALDQIGFEDATISFSGFWSQGDGARFTAGVNLDKLVAFLSDIIEPKTGVEFVERKEQFRPYVVHRLGRKPTNPKYRRLLFVRDSIQDVAVERTSHYYSHERTCRFTAWLNDNGHSRVRSLLNGFVEDAESLRLALCKTIYGMLEDDYWDRVSEEQLLDFAQANDYTFEANGRREG